MKPAHSAAREGNAVLGTGLALFPEHVAWLERALLALGGVGALVALGVSARSPERRDVAIIAIGWQLTASLAVWGARRWASLAWRRAVLLSYVYFYVALSLFIVGPKVGVGAGLMAAASLSAVLFARRGVFIAAAVSAALLSAAGFAFVLRWISPSLAFIGVDQAAYWIRITLMTCAVTLAVGLGAAMISSWFSQVYQRTVEALKEQDRELDERAHAKRALEAAARNETIGQLAGGIAHDINNNLAVVLTNAQLLEEDDNGTAKEVELLAAMMTAAREATQSARDVLALGRGARRIPTSDASDAAPASTAPTTFEPSSIRVLLVDDEPAIRKVLGRMVRKAGYEVVEAHDGASATEAFNKPEPFDLLLTDAVMPNTDTGAMIRAFREKHPAKPIIVCSGYVRQELVLKGIASGEYAFIAKPFRPEELTDLLRMTLLEAKARHFDGHAQESSV